jgi:hypothetical protein
VVVSPPAPGPGANPAPSPTPGPSPAPGPRPQRPGAKTKEKKVRVKRGKIVQYIGGVTEWLDAINCLYDSVPNHLKPGYYPLHRKDGSVYYKRRWKPNQKQRAQAVYRHVPDLNFTKAFQCLLQNEIEDRAIGKVSQKLGKAHAGSFGDRPLGITSGPWDTFAVKLMG